MEEKLEKIKNDGLEKLENAKTVEEFAFGKLTLIKVKNGKIDKYIESLDTIKEELSV